MKTLIALNNPKLKKMLFGEETVNRLKGFSQVEWLDDYDAFADVIGDYDACITSWGSPRFTPEVLERAEKLKFIGHGAGTVVPYMDELVFQKDITVINANYILSRATAEGAVAMMTAASYRLFDYNRMLKGGGWADNDAESVPGLCHQTIGIIGYGEISREVIRLLQPYEPRILLYSGYCSKEEAEKIGISLVSLDELLCQANIISLHNTLTERTRGMIGRRELGLMKDGAVLLNTARGPIIDEEALIETLASGRICAVLDVYGQEPLPMDNPLRRLPNTWLFPHVAAYSEYWKKRLGLYIAEELERWTKGEVPKGIITPEKYRRMTPH